MIDMIWKNYTIWMFTWHHVPRTQLKTPCIQVILQRAEHCVICLPLLIREVTMALMMNVWVHSFGVIRYVPSSKISIARGSMACISRWTSELNSKTLLPTDSGTSPILTNLSPLYLNISRVKSKSAWLPGSAGMCSLLFLYKVHPIFLCEWTSVGTFSFSSPSRFWLKDALT